MKYALAGFVGIGFGIWAIASGQVEVMGWYPAVLGIVLGLGVFAFLGFFMLYPALKKARTTSCDTVPTAADEPGRRLIWWCALHYESIHLEHLCGVAQGRFFKLLFANPPPGEQTLREFKARLLAGESLRSIPDAEVETLPVDSATVLYIKSDIWSSVYIERSDAGSPSTLELPLLGPGVDEATILPELAAAAGRQSIEAERRISINEALPIAPTLVAMVVIALGIIGIATRGQAAAGQRNQPLPALADYFGTPGLVALVVLTFAAWLSYTIYAVIHRKALPAIELV